VTHCHERLPKKPRVEVRMQTLVPTPVAPR
jgi:hypothetical protein